MIKFFPVEMLTADLVPVIELNEDMIKSVPVTMLNAVLDPVKLIELDEDMMKASPVEMRTVAVDPVKLKLDDDMIKSTPAEMLKFIMFAPLMELDDDMAKFSVNMFKLPAAMNELFSIRIPRACTVIASDV